MELNHLPNEEPDLQPPEGKPHAAEFEPERLRELLSLAHDYEAFRTARVKRKLLQLDLLARGLLLAVALLLATSAAVGVLTHLFDAKVAAALAAAAASIAAGVVFGRGPGAS